MYHKFHSDLRRIYVRFVFLGKTHGRNTAEEIDASFLRHFPAYTITSRLSHSPSRLISGSGSWLVGKFTLHQKLSLSRENFYNCKKGTTFELPVSERVSGRLREVVVYESWTARGLLRVEVRAHLLFGENVMHAIVRLHASMLFLTLTWAQRPPGWAVCWPLSCSGDTVTFSLPSAMS